MIFRRRTRIEIEHTTLRVSGGDLTPVVVPPAPSPAEPSFARVLSFAAPEPTGASMERTISRHKRRSTWWGLTLGLTLSTVLLAGSTATLPAQVTSALNLIPPLVRRHHRSALRADCARFGGSCTLHIRGVGNAADRTSVGACECWPFADRQTYRTGVLLLRCRRHRCQRTEVDKEPQHDDQEPTCACLRHESTHSCPGADHPAGDRNGYDPAAITAAASAAHQAWLLMEAAMPGLRTATAEGLLSSTLLACSQTSRTMGSPRPATLLSIPNDEPLR